jgi:hypothetical protein
MGEGRRLGAVGADRIILLFVSRWRAEQLAGSRERPHVDEEPENELVCVERHDLVSLMTIGAIIFSLAASRVARGAGRVAANFPDRGNFLAQNVAIVS